MSKMEEAIAELVIYLPVFMKALLEEGNIKTKANLNISEEKTLLYIHKRKGATMTEYSKGVGLARGSFTAVADSLEQKGLVERVSGTDDRRKFVLVLTDEGKGTAREIESQFKEHVAARLACLEKEDLGQLKTALETIVITIEKLNAKRKQQR